MLRRVIQYHINKRTMQLRFHKKVDFGPICPMPTICYSGPIQTKFGHVV